VSRESVTKSLEEPKYGEEGGREPVHLEVNQGERVKSWKKWGRLRTKANREKILREVPSWVEKGI